MVRKYYSETAVIDNTLKGIIIDMIDVVVNTGKVEMSKVNKTTPYTDTYYEKLVYFDDIVATISKT